MKRYIKKFLKSRAVLLPVLYGNRLLRKINYLFHGLQFFLQWRSGGGTPEWFDHYIDLHFLWGRRDGNCHWLERGIFSLLAMKDGARVLELCCGSGFNAKYFYSYRAATIVSCDFDPVAIRHARRHHTTQKNHFLVADIRSEMPEGKFDNVIWDAAIEHFTPEEIRKIMFDIKEKLETDGILSGQTIVKRTEGKSLEQHEYEFASKEDLMRFLSPHFRHVKVFETIYPDRHNLYFYASDGILPLTKEWNYMLDKE